jgi:hypothetical protein
MIPSTRPTYRLGSTKNPLDGVLEELANQLVSKFSQLFNKTFDPETAEIQVVQIFEIQQTREFSLAVKKGIPLEEITQVIGGEMIEGQMEHLQKTFIDNYCAGLAYRDYMDGKNNQKRKRTTVDTSN